MIADVITLAKLRLEGRAAATLRGLAIQDRKKQVSLSQLSRHDERQFIPTVGLKRENGLNVT
jgi:hypothetical protein